MGFSSNALDVGKIVKKWQPLVMAALQNAADRIRSGNANDALLRWFGDNSADFQSEARRKIATMRSQANVRTIKVGRRGVVKQAGGGIGRGDAGENAAAFPSTGTVTFKVRSLPGSSTTRDSRFAGNNMFISSAWGSLPDYLPMTGGTVDAGGWNQSKMNTFVHELSHLLMGTEDVSVGGYTVYGAQRAELLAANLPDGAKVNAENWGIFVEAVGHHEAS